MRSQRSSRILPLPVFIKNAIPEGTSLPFASCHPVLTSPSESIMVPGTAFQLLMGPHKQKIVCGVYLSPTEWYVDGVSHLTASSDSDVHFDLKKFPGSHIPSCLRQQIQATMFIERIKDESFIIMVKSMKPRMVSEIGRRCLPVMDSPFIEVYVSDPNATVPMQSSDTLPINERKHGHSIEMKAEFQCDVCPRVYTSQTRLNKHVIHAHGGRTTTKIFNHDHSQRLSSLSAQPPLSVRQQPSPFTYEYFGTATPANDEVPFITSTTPLLTEVDVAGSIAILPHSEIKVPPRRMMVVDSDSDDSVSHQLIPSVSGLSSMEILKIAHDWPVGQEFLMLYKEKSDIDGTEYEAHGMFYRWDFCDPSSPGPMAYFPEERRKRHKTSFCEECVDCTATNIVVSLTAIEETTTFDGKRRKLNQEH